MCPPSKGPPPKASRSVQDVSYARPSAASCLQAHACRSPKISWSLPSAHSLPCSELFPGSFLHPSSENPPVTPHSILHPAWKDAHFQVSPPPELSLQAHLHRPSSGTSLPSRPQQGQVAWAPPGCSPSAQSEPIRAWRDGGRDPRPRQARAWPTRWAEFEEQTQILNPEPRET